MSIKFAVIGLGHIGSRHAEMIRRNTQAVLVATADVDPSKHADYLSAEEMLANESVDVVCVCTPNGWHKEHAVATIEAGCHVVVEKPLALCVADCEAIIKAAEEYKKQVFCVMQNRYSPPSVWLKEMMDSGRLGQIYAVQLNCLWNRDKRYYTAGSWHGSKDLDGGTLFTQFSHFIDIMYWTLGDIVDIHTVLRNFNHQQLTDFEDSGFCTFRFQKSNAVGTLTYTTATWGTNMESSLTITAEHGTIRIAGQYMNEVTYCHVRDYEMPKLLPSNPPNDYGAYKGSAQNHHYVIQNVIDVLTQGKQPTTPATDGMHVVDIIQRIYASAETDH